MRIFTRYPDRQRSKLRKILSAILTLVILCVILDELYIYLYKRCKFYTKDEGGGIPVVLISLGRSGSSVTWDTMSALTGERTVAYEVTGGSAKKNERFFRNIRWELGSRWAVCELCSIQKKWPTDAGIIGFQWKVSVCVLSA